MTSQGDVAGIVKEGKRLHREARAGPRGALAPGHRTCLKGLYCCLINAVTLANACEDSPERRKHVIHGGFSLLNLGFVV